MAEKVNEALLKAAAVGSLTGVKEALEAGADINFEKRAFSIERVTAFFIAAYVGHVDIVKLLLRKGASVVKRTEGAYTPLHGASMMDRTEVIEVLIHHGATVDVRDGYQMTPIMYACHYGYVDTVRRLIEFGARVDLVDEKDISVLEFCGTETNPYTKHGLLRMMQETTQKKRTKCSNPEGGKPDRSCEHRQKEADSNHGECMKLVQEALEKKQLRCCNPKCGKPGHRSTLKLCAACKLTRYCSRECQKHHWSVGHKKCCGQDGYSGPVPDEYHTIEYMMMCAMAKARGVKLDICSCSLCQ